MRLLKPSWVGHDGKPIFSIDIHPDGSRFATGGQGDNSGKVAIWNMAPVRDEEAEQNESIPKLLCQMENHLACVNCVRWSKDGKYLASAGDDKLVMIWQMSRYGGVSTVFGSNVVNHEQWRVVSTLRGHSGDVLDMAWSPHDAWLATCSVDNTIVVWNATKFPEQLSVLRGHSGMVKGVTWDPVGNYLASQSDDKSLKVWRTRDWQLELEVTEPFQECAGTTHVLRLDWSPDGQYLVSAHAMNNSGPTAQIVEREGWKTVMDFVGHRKAITVVRFNPKILCSKNHKKQRDKMQQFSCCAIGSRDRSLSIWLTSLKRPLVVTHDLFTNSVVDISWTSCGMELLCCSTDGTVAFLGFSEEEIGNPLPAEEKVKMHEKLYGKSLLSKSAASSTQIIESAALFNMQQKKEREEEKARQEEVQKTKAAAAQNTPSKNGSGNSVPGSVQGTPVKHIMTKQIETRTKEGKRRITPIFLSPGPDSVAGTPMPFSSGAEPTFSSCKEVSSIGVEKRGGEAPTAAWIKENSLGATAPVAETPPRKQQDSESKAIPADKEKEQPSKKEVPVEKPNPTVNSPEKQEDTESTALSVSQKHKMPPGSFQAVPLKKEKRGRPRKDKTLERQHQQQQLAAAAAAQSVAAQPTAAAQPVSKIVYTNSGLDLAVPGIQKSISIQISGCVGSDSALVLEVENHLSTGGPGSLHQLRCLKAGTPCWMAVLPSAAIACAGNSILSCVACTDCSLSVYGTPSGRRLGPAMVLDSKVSALRCSAHYLMAITSRGSLHVWNVNTMTAVIKNESLVSLVSSSDVHLDSCLLTEQGLPVISLSTGSSFTYKTDLGCWVLLSQQQDTLQMCSDHFTSIPALSACKTSGPLATLQAGHHRAGSQASRLFRVNGALQKAATLSHLESQVSSCLALKSASEFHFWLLAYVRYMVQEGLEDKLRDLCHDLLGPTHKSKNGPKWEPTLLTYKKRDLLEEVLPIFVENLNLQRLYTEFKEQLDAVTA